MSSVKIHVIGRLGGDAEMKQTRSGKEFSTFNVAVDDFVNGEKTTSWFTVADFTDVARRRAEFLKKGSLIEVQGIETCRLFTDRNNVTRIARDIRATHIDFIPTGKSEKTDTVAETVSCGTLPTAKEPQVIQPQVAVSASVSASNDLIDDLPF